MLRADLRQGLSEPEPAALRPVEASAAARLQRPIAAIRNPLSPGFGSAGELPRSWRCRTRLRRAGARSSSIGITPSSG
jgi:hypothetical protein